MYFFVELYLSFFKLESKLIDSQYHLAGIEYVLEFSKSKERSDYYKYKWKDGDLK